MENIDLYKKIELAKLKQKEGEILEANKIYQGLLKKNSDSFDFLYAYGLFCKEIRNFNLAKKVFLKLIKNYPSSINSYILLAEILRMEYKFNDAEKVLQKAIKTDHNHGDLLYNCSLLYFAWRKLDNALAYINKAIKISINNDIYKILKSEIYINKYNFDEALKILKVIKNVQEDNNIAIRVNILIANAYIKKREFEEAEKILLMLIKKYKRLELA